MNSMVIEPMEVVAKLQPEPLQALEIASIDKFGFEDLERRFRYGVVVRAALQAERAFDLKCG